MFEDDDDSFDDAMFYGTAEPEASDSVPPADGGEDLTEAPEGTDETSEPEQPQAKYFDPSEFADHVVRVKVDGEEIDVPVADLAAGYSRTADYTRKTQALAQEREQIAFWQQVDQAMKVNPQMTLQYLEQQYGISPAQASAGVAAAQDDEDEWGYVDPATKALRDEVRELRQLMQPLATQTRQQQIVAALEQTVAQLTAKYGDDFNADEVIQEATRRGVKDVREIESVYRDMAFDRYRALSAAQQLQQANSAASTAQRRAAAQQASAQVTAGGSARGVNAPPPVHERNLTAREAARLALQELRS